MTETRPRSLLVHVALAALVYIPIGLSSRGVVGADTKTYLYLDPGRLLERAPTMWDPNVGLGTLTHQNIGYLFPIGPWYWAFDTLGAPDWFAQRMWLATILFAAGAGVLFLGRTLAWRGVAPIAAALLYMLSPYVLDYSARISVILLPWAALPWLVGLADRGLRAEGGRLARWKHPALFALVVLTVGGVNATALVFAGLGPVLWFPFAVANREATWRHALATVARIGVLTVLVSLWWVAGLAVQAAFGIEILRFTETIEAVSVTSLSSEVLRGLGYWFFYGNDKLGPWIEPSVTYTQNVPLIALTFLLPVLGLAAAAAVRWRHRGYATCLIVVGTFIAVGAYPYEMPSMAGQFMKAFGEGSTVGLALRSTARAVPLVVLGFSLAFAAAITAMAQRAPRAALATGGLCAVLAVANMPPLFTGDIAVVDNLNRAEEIPAYWREAATYLDSRGSGSRVLEVPGTDFASYRWGNTVDPLTPYLMDRPYVARELIPLGSRPSADLLNAFDRRLQEGLFEPEAIAPIARLLGAGDIVLRNDLQYERFRTPRPRQLWRWFSEPRPSGLGEPVAFGDAEPNLPDARLPLVDETELGLPARAPHPNPVVAFPVEDAPGIVKTTPAAQPLIVSADGEGLVDLAAAGLLDAHRIIRYSADDGTELVPGAHYVVTDTNRRRARRWGTVRENVGYTEGANATPLVRDPADARLDVFPNAPASAFTTVEQRGVTSVRATRYGNPVSYTPEDRPANGVDGDPRTAWRVGAFSDVTGERIEVELLGPRAVGAIRLLQPINGPRNRYITEARVHLDGESIDLVLDESSRTEGQVVTFPPREVTSIAVEIVETNVGKRARYDGLSGVGLAEIDIGNDASVAVDEIVRMPTDLTDRLRDGDVTYVMTRLRSDPAVPVRSDEELQIKRRFHVPGHAEFRIEGVARLSASVPDDVVDRILRTPMLAERMPVARSDARLLGELRARAASAIDGDPTTAWTPGLLDQVGHWIEVETPDPITIDRLDLQLVADGRHSVPTRMRIDVDGQLGVRYVDVPDIADRAETGTAVAAPVSFPAMTGRVFRFALEDVRSVKTIDYFGNAPIDLPVGIAELGIPGVRGAPPAGLHAECRDDLVQIDGRAVPVRLTASTPAALDRDALRIESCGPIELADGDHELRTALGRDDGIDVDRLVLAPVAAAPATAIGPTASRAVRVVDETRTSLDVELGRGSDPVWLVLGQSHNAGWRATASGRDLGPPQLVDGYANGWLVPPGVNRVHLEWTPQRPVWVALATSAVGALICLLLLVLGRRGVVAPRADAPPVFAVQERARPALVRRAVAAIVATTFGFVVAGPLAAGAVLVISLVAASHRRADRIADLAPAAALSLAAMYVVIQQVRYDYPPDFAWPANFALAHLFGWTAVVVLLERVWVGSRRHDGHSGAEPLEELH